MIPSGIYTDLGAKQLRELLFSGAQLESLLSMSNERYIFEGIHHAFKLCVIIFEKGGITTFFRAAFRINPREAIAPDRLDAFLNSSTQHLTIPVQFIRHLSPDSLSVIEFRSAMDIQIAEKLQHFPLVGEKRNDSWNLALTQELNMTTDSHLFQSTRLPSRLPLYEGKMIWQFSHRLADPRYWIEEKEGRATILGRQSDYGGKLDYQQYRLAFRDVSASTNERTIIATVLPPDVFCPHTMSVEKVTDFSQAIRLYIVAILNSFVVDYVVRQRVTGHVSFFYIYQLPVPRLTEKDSAFAPIVERAAKLICTTPEYDDLAAEVGLGSHAAGVTNPTEREQLRAELDAMIAHLYGLTEIELTHILGTFPLVEQRVKDNVLTEFRRRTPDPDDEQVAALIAAGESDRIEFKESAVWNTHTNKKDATLIDPIVKAIAAFLNGNEIGNVFIGVDAAWRVVGIATDITAASPKQDLDNYERAVRTALSAKLGGQNSPYYSSSIHTVGAHQVLRIAVSPAPDPVYVDGDFYIRDGGGKKKLNAQQTMAYIQRRWPSH